MVSCPYSPFDIDVMADPYPFYAWLRAHAPVYEVPDAGAGMIEAKCRYRTPE